MNRKLIAAAILLAAAVPAWANGPTTDPNSGDTYICSPRMLIYPNGQLTMRLLMLNFPDDQHDC